MTEQIHEASGLTVSTLDHLRELQRLRERAGAPALSIAELAALLLEKLHETAGRAH